jgi:hypothetical protein
MAAVQSFPYYGSAANNNGEDRLERALITGSVLIPGTSETVGEFDDLGVPIVRKHNLYRRKDDVCDTTGETKNALADLPPGSTPSLGRICVSMWP